MTDLPHLSFENLKARLTKLGEFAAVFEADGFKFAEMHGGNEIEPGVYVMPWSELSDAALQFVDTCYTDGWVIAEFNWSNWVRTAEAAGLLNDASNPSPGIKLADADPEQLAKLLTAIVRNERGCEGYLASTFESGLMMGIVRRAKELTETM
jgi:hypothetical protein